MKLNVLKGLFIIITASLFVACSNSTPYPEKEGYSYKELDDYLKEEDSRIKKNAAAHGKLYIDYLNLLCYFDNNGFVSTKEISELQRNVMDNIGSTIGLYLRLIESKEEKEDYIKTLERVCDEGVRYENLKDLVKELNAWLPDVARELLSEDENIKN
ncbi:MAG: hypothetical protein U0L22_08080 [Bacteroidales bacterium]|nr:hypothetical protein [Bacteroidales bacterium]